MPVLLIEDDVNSKFAIPANKINFVGMTLKDDEWDVFVDHSAGCLNPMHLYRGTKKDKAEECYLRVLRLLN